MRGPMHTSLRAQSGSFCSIVTRQNRCLRLAVNARTATDEDRRTLKVSAAASAGNLILGLNPMQNVYHLDSAASAAKCVGPIGQPRDGLDTHT